MSTLSDENLELSAVNDYLMRRVTALEAALLEQQRVSDGRLEHVNKLKHLLQRTRDRLPPRQWDDEGVAV